MRTLILYKRDNEQFGCIVDHHESIAFDESEEARSDVQHYLSADDNSMFFVELPNNTFRPTVLGIDGEECPVMFHEIRQVSSEDDA